MTKAKAGSSRHGPSSPKPGIRTMTTSGRMARTASTSRPELLEHPRRVVLDDDVAGRDQPAQQRPGPRSVAEVEGHALLVGVQPGEDPGPLPPVGLREAQAGEQAGAVGPGGRLEVEHLGAQHRQHVGARAGRPRTRSGRAPAGRANGSRSGRRRAPARSAPAAGGSRRRSSCSPSRGAGSAVAEQGRVEPVRPVGFVEAVPAGSATIEPRATKWSVAGIVAPLPIGACGMRKAAASSRTSAVVCSAIHAAIVGLQVGAVDEERAVLHPLGMADHHAEVEPLLAGPDAEADQPVARGLHARASTMDRPLRNGRPTMSA